MSAPQSALMRRRFGLNYYEDEYGVKGDVESFEHAADLCEDDSDAEEEYHDASSTTHGQVAGFFKPYAQSLTKSDASPLTGRGLFSNTTPKHNINININTVDSRQSASPSKHTLQQHNTPSRRLTPKKLGMFGAPTPSFASDGAGFEAPPLTVQESIQPSFPSNLGDLNDSFPTLEEGKLPANPYLIRGDNAANEAFEAFLRYGEGDNGVDEVATSHEQAMQEHGTTGEQQVIGSSLTPPDDQAPVSDSGATNVAASTKNAHMVDDEGYQGDREEVQATPEVKSRKRRAGILAEICDKPVSSASPKKLRMTTENEPNLGRTRAATTKAIEDQKPTRPNTRSSGAVVVIKKIRTSKRDKAAARAATMRKKAKKVDPDTPQRVSKKSAADGTRKSARTGGLRSWKDEKLELSPGQGIVVVAT